jgi:hypothetical protein
MMVMKVDSSRIKAPYAGNATVIDFDDILLSFIYKIYLHISQIILNTHLKCWLN